MKKNFMVGLAFVLRWEGGYVDDPRDPGGETKYGISKRSYPHLNIKSLTKEQAAEIYKTDYWNKVGGDTLPFPFDIIVFDTAVNCGVGRATKWLGQAKTGKDYLFLRLKHYSRLNGDFLRGWVNRVVALHELINSIKEGG
jgi:lysozyme family protein